MSIPTLPDYPLPTPAEFPVTRVAWALQPSRAVLLVHDMQDYFLRFWGQGSPLVAQLTERLAALCDWARRQGVPVVYTAQPAQQSPVDRALLNDLWGPGLTAADPALAAIVAPLAPQPGDTVLTKWRYSAFQRSDLEERMRHWGRDQLLIGGVYAHIGCLMTAVEACMRDIQPFLVGDAVADFSAEDHAMALRYVAGRAGRVIGASAVLGLEPAGLDRAAFEASVLACLPEAPAELAGDENLLDHGLDSVQVMELVAAWARQGVRVRFEELAMQPNLDHWWQVLCQARAQLAPPQSPPTPTAALA